MNGFSVRGVVEGFYGAAYTQSEREGLLRFLGALGYDTYYYGPKNDRMHRARWREPYGEQALSDFSRSVEVAGAAGVEFVYTLSPGLDIRYSSDGDMRAIQDKFTCLMGRNVRSFGLFLDDINPTFKHQEDAEKFGSFARAQAELCNRMLEWLRQRVPAASLVMCPTTYHGAPPFGDYLHELGELLHPEIDVFYTGVDVCSRAIGSEEVAAFGKTLRRAPLLWDNYPVNDGGMSSELHVEPIRGRSADLAGYAKGFAVNPMNQAEASKITLHTFAAYLSDPARYDPETAWRTAIAAVVGSEQAAAFESFALTTRHGVMTTEPAPKLARLAAAAHEALNDYLAETVHPSDRRPAKTAAQAASPSDITAVRELSEYLDELDEACYELKFYLRNYALRAEILPWVEALENWVWSARRAIELVDAAVLGGDVDRALRRLDEPFRNARSHHKRSGGSELLGFVETALRGVQAVPA